MMTGEALAIREHDAKPAEVALAAILLVLEDILDPIKMLATEALDPILLVVVPRSC